MRGSQRESGHSQFLQVFQAFSGTVVLSLVPTARDDGFYHKVTIELKAHMAGCARRTHCTLQGTQDRRPFQMIFIKNVCIRLSKGKSNIIFKLFYINS